MKKNLVVIGNGMAGARAVEEILADFPVLKCRAKLEGAVVFIKAHPKEINAYLAEQDQKWEEARKLNPRELVEKVRKYREERKLKPV